MPRSFRIEYAVYDGLTGAFRFRIEDADTSRLEGIPLAWSTRREASSRTSAPTAKPTC